MTSRRKPEMKMVQELQRTLRNRTGEEIETICGLMADLTEDPGADHTPGELARLGALFTEMGGTLTDAARGQASRDKLREDEDVFFTYREPGEQQRVNTAYLKEKFPPVNYPEMWQRVPTKGSVSLDLPFRTKCQATVLKVNRNG